MQNDIAMLCSYYKEGLISAGLVRVRLDFNLDSHDAGSASNQPENYMKIVNSIKKIIDTLKSIQYSEDLSMYDQTTFAISSEFSRTMRQLGRTMEDTGTDHNQHNNSIFIGGKGIKSGLVIGATDMDKLDENGQMLEVSKFHRKKDHKLLKFFGKAYNFAEDSSYLPDGEVFDELNHITPKHVMNTIFKIYGVNEENYRTIGRDEIKAPIIRALLA